MDSRLYFVLGDLFSNVLTGAVVGWLCAMAVAVGWNMFLAMLLTMAIGMAVGLLMSLPLGALFGAMEVMVPTMFGGMVSGMVVGMWAAMEPLGSAQSLVIGAGCGLGSILFVWTLNTLVRGRRTFSGGV